MAGASPQGEDGTRAAESTAQSTADKSVAPAHPHPAAAGEDPDAFDPFRVPPSGHLAFGHGIHRCIGAELARMELRIVLPLLLRRFPELTLEVPESELNFRQLSFVFGVEELPVRLRP